MIMEKIKKTDLKKVVEKSRIKKIDKKAVKTDQPIEGAIPPLKEYSVEPVVKPQNKRKKPKGAIKHEEKPTKKTDGKTNAGAIKEVEKKPEAGEKSSVPVPSRKRGFFAWFVDGGK